MIDTEITVTGMGGGINFEMKVIQKALEDAGYDVLVENSAADWVCSQGEDYVEKCIRHNLAKNPKYQIKLIAKHIPWGG